MRVAAAFPFFGREEGIGAVRSQFAGLVRAGGVYGAALVVCLVALQLLLIALIAAMLVGLVR
jgi:hypothetical protein